MGFNGGIGCPHGVFLFFFLSFLFYYEAFGERKIWWWRGEQRAFDMPVFRGQQWPTSNWWKIFYDYNYDWRPRGRMTGLASFWLIHITILVFYFTHISFICLFVMQCSLPGVWLSNRFGIQCDNILSTVTCEPYRVTTMGCYRSRLSLIVDIIFVLSAI